MKICPFKLIALLIISLFVISCQTTQSSSESIVQAEGPFPSIIPMPQSLVWGEKMYRIPKANQICYNEGGEKAAVWLQELLTKSNTNAEISSGIECGNWQIVADPELEAELGEEGYILEISQNGVILKGASEAGLFYAVQTVRQMLPAEIEKGSPSQEDVLIRQVVIVDQPRYSWRGTMLDIARSFFGPDYIKEHLDRMALYKLNRLHLHLTDDQGWRIEIKEKPKLTEVASRGAVKGGRSGYLSREEYIEIQEYAADRNIIIIPEIDMPGHIYSALLAYPELNCEDLININPRMVTPPQLFHEYEVGWSKLCLEKPEVYEFIEVVLGELAQITAGPYLHIGGDEIKDPLYRDFVLKADEIVRKLGKTTIGWEEVTQAAVDNSFISQRWNGQTESVVDTRIIESICSSFYFDHANIPGQEFTNNWCKKDGVSLKDTYSFTSENPDVIGVEAPVWTEKVLSDDVADNRFWPRSIAMAEVAWTKEENKDYNKFLERLGNHGLRLDYMRVNYFRSPEVNWNSERRKGVFSGFDPAAIMQRNR